MSTVQELVVEKDPEKTIFKTIEETEAMQNIGTELRANIFYRKLLG